MKLVLLLGQCGRCAVGDLPTLKSGVLSLIQLFEPLEALIFAVPMGADPAQIGQRLASSLPFKRQTTSQLVLDFIERLDDRLTEIMKVGCDC